MCFVMKRECEFKALEDGCTNIRDIHLSFVITQELPLLIGILERSLPTMTCYMYPLYVWRNMGNKRRVHNADWQILLPRWHFSMAAINF